MARNDQIRHKTFSLLYGSVRVAFSQVIAHQRVFRPEDQQRFMVISGDNNPVHLDPVRARRFLFGKPVVHGAHILMWALDSLFATRKGTYRISAVRASFRRPVFPGDQLTIEYPSDAEESVRLDITSAGEVKASVLVEFSRIHSVSDQTRSPHPEAPTLCEPRVLTDDDLPGLEGTLALHLPETEYRRLFPNLARSVEPFQASALLSISRLVGVECPGLNSILYEIDLSDEASQVRSDMNYRVTAFDERTQRVSLDVVSPLLSGNVIAFVRPEPVSQADCAELSVLVEDNEFSDQNALVVGASRGLGEVTAKLLTMGGAAVTGTFNVGKDDADQVAEEIGSVGGRIRFVHLDVTQSDFVEWFTNKGDSDLTHLYYFCSPRIPLNQTGKFSSEALEDLVQFYVCHFIELTNVLVESRLSRAFYPSTVFLDETPPGMEEYSIAKSAGEAACAILEKTYPELRIYRPRLPVTNTDQTASILPVRRDDPSILMLKHLREFVSL